MFQKALEQSRITKNRHYEGLSLKHLGIVSLALTDYSEAAKNAKKSLEIAKEIDNQTLKKNTLNVLGLVYYWQEKYAEAIHFYQQAVSIPSESAAENWKVLNNLGLAYYLQTDYPKAIVSYNKAMQYAEQDGSNLRISTTLKNLGDTLFWKGDYPQAIKYFLQALPATDIKEQKGHLHVALGESYSKNGQYEHAVNQFKNALEIFNKTNNTFIQTNTLNALAMAYTALGNSKEAMVFSQKAINLAATNNHSALESNAWGTMAGAMPNLNKIEEAPRLMKIPYV